MDAELEDHHGRTVHVMETVNGYGRGSYYKGESMSNDGGSSS